MMRTGARTTRRRRRRSASNGRPRHAFRRGARHERHVHRHGPPASQLNPGVALVSVQPDSPLHGIEGLKHMESAIVPGDLRSDRWPTRISECRPKTAHATVRRLAADDGSARRRVERRGAGRRSRGRVAVLPTGVIVTIFPGRRRSIPVRAVLGRARQRVERRADPARGRRRDSRARRADLSRRVLRRADRIRIAVGDSHVRARQHDTTRARAAFSRRTRRLPSAPKRAAARPARDAPRLLSLASGSSRRGRRQFDLDHAWPNLSYVIVCGRTAQARRRCASWRLRADRPSASTRNRSRCSMKITWLRPS